MERTTDLKRLKAGTEFTWGEIIKIHEIGEYAIVEAHPWKVKDGIFIQPGIPDMSKTDFHAYVKGGDCSHSFDSFDSALAYCIAYKYDGINTQAGHYFMKMLGQ
jgi:hypothetical protein